MNQSNVIAGVLFAAFVVFITSRGELPSYMRVFFGSAGGGATPTGATKTGAAPAATPQEAAKATASSEKAVSIAGAKIATLGTPSIINPMAGALDLNKNVTDLMTSWGGVTAFGNGILDFIDGKK